MYLVVCHGRVAEKKEEKDSWNEFKHGGRTFLPAAHYWKWCLAKNKGDRLDAYVKKKQSSSGPVASTFTPSAFTQSRRMTRGKIRTCTSGRPTRETRPAGSRARNTTE